MNQAEKEYIYSRNIKVLPFIFGFLTTPLYFFFAIYAYFVTESFLLVSIVLSFGEIVKSVMEVPTGVISDRFLGRKGSQSMADLFMIIGVIIQIFALYEWKLLLLGEFFVGISLSLYSGNVSSFLHDTLSLVNKEEEYHKNFAKMEHYRYLHMSFSLLVVGLLSYFFGIVFCLYYCVLQKTISLIVGLLLKEPNIHNINEKSTIKEGFLHITKSAKKIYKTPKLKSLAVLSVFRKSLDSLDRIGMIFYKEIISFLTFGFILSGSLFFSNFGVLYSEKITRKFGFLQTFIWIRLISIPLQVIGYYIGNFYSIILIEIGESLNPIETSAQSALLHKEFTDKQRATMESVVEVVGSLGYSIFALFFGWLAEVWSLSVSLIIGAISKFLIIPICLKIFKKS